MLGSLRYRRNLTRLQRENDKVIAPYVEAVRKAERENKTESEIDELRQHWMKQRSKNRERIGILETSYLTKVARAKLLSIPPYPIFDSHDIFGKTNGDSKWRVSKYNDLEMFLIPEARRGLRLAIRADNRERLEMWRLWITTAVTGLTGLIGVVIGLLAILGRR